MDPRQALEHDPAPVPIMNDVPIAERLVSAAFDDSWSTLDQEVALIDRLFGGDIAALFERHDDGGRQHVRR